MREETVSNELAVIDLIPACVRKTKRRREANLLPLTVRIPTCKENSC